ncbi:ABC transporter permease [Bacillus sp. JCM 19034]|uniref:ABC transporter permease n=1 Tax=Bacillus sp. JCM 19034 TaxID=1481928 RepID=UPI0007817A06|nr:ABC transporter permease [Bacillus sp. JCM 19034]
MYNLIKAEFVKLRKNRTFQILIGLSIVVAISLVTLFILATHNVLYVEIYDGFSIMQATPDQHFHMSGMESFYSTLWNNPVLLLVIISVLAGFFISNDYRSGAFKNAIVCGNERLYIYTAKWITFTSGIIIILTVYSLLITVGMSLLFSFWAGSEGILDMIRTFWLYLVHVIGYCSIIALLAFLVEESGKTITLSIVVVGGLWIVLVFSARNNPFMADLYQLTFFYQLVAVAELPQTTWEITKGILGSLITIVASSTVGVTLFERKELK